MNYWYTQQRGMILKYSISSKRSQTQKSTYTLILFIGNLNKDKINLFI